jgi:hypothetical protein
LKPIYLYLIIGLAFFNSCKKEISFTTNAVKISKLDSPTLTSINGISYVGGTIFISAGDGVYKSADMGSSWVKLSSLPNAAYSKISFLSPDTGIVYSSGKLYYTENGGINFSSTTITATDVRLRGSIGYLLSKNGDDGIIYKSTNKGKTWVVMKYYSQIGSLNVVNIINNYTVSCTGLNRDYISTDNGYTWNLNSFGTELASAESIIDTYHIDAESTDYTKYNKFYFTLKSHINDGYVDEINLHEDFENQDYNEAGVLYYKIKFYNKDRALIVGQNSILRKQGSDWVYCWNIDGTTIPYTFLNFEFIDENTVMAVGTSGLICLIEI